MHCSRTTGKYSAARPGLYAPHYALLNKMQHGKPTADVFAHLSDAILALS